MIPKHIKSALPYLLLLGLIIWAGWQTVMLAELGRDVIAQRSEQAAPSAKMEARQTSAIFTPRHSPKPAPAPAFIANLDIPLAPELQRHTYEVADAYDIPPEIILAIMWHESRYQIDAVGHNSNGTYDSGLCQINSVNHVWLMEDHGLDVADPADNIEAAAVILSGYMERYTLDQALAAYAVGESGMLAGGGRWFAEIITERQAST